MLNVLRFSFLNLAVFEFVERRKDIIDYTNLLKLIFLKISMLSLIDINDVELEAILLEANLYFSDWGHGVRITCKEDLDNGSLRVVYDFFINGVYQSTHDYVFSPTQLEPLTS